MQRILAQLAYIIGIGVVGVGLGVAVPKGIQLFKSLSIWTTEESHEDVGTDYCVLPFPGEVYVINGTIYAGAYVGPCSSIDTLSIET
jgi:hypothetical protein